MSADDLLRVYYDSAEITSYGDYTGYPWGWWDAKHWTPTIKDYVREQTGHRCQRCQHPYRKGEHGNGEWSRCDAHCKHGGPLRYRTGSGEYVSGQTSVEYGLQGGYGIDAQWRILTVHHLNGAKHDCRWWNLAALCQRCHLTIQAKVYMERVWDKPHSEWFKPHAAGWYASRYLGEELTREQTTARLDELLDLELRQEQLW